MASNQRTITKHALHLRPAQQEFTRNREAVGRARRFVRETITGHVPTDRADDIIVCASELATNALRHTPPGRQFRVCVTVTADSLRLEVHDAGEGKPELREAAAHDDSGRGLFLVATLADGWGTSPRDGLGKLVWAEFTLAEAKRTASTEGPPSVAGPRTPSTGSSPPVATSTGVIV
ncbi:ATP-binding protein [Streptomyces boluensis]|uniref:ATP-binding protein n=1 Tax=Streptomyces boluensis TaxID=1775135 RepID=A0A964XNX3_9ACTN|nr:ATP-binding protein [Streptomyces boluensis]NBE54636.1 ATP-binding protein [Streptomyces boluensis]